MTFKFYFSAIVHETSIYNVFLFFYFQFAEKSAKLGNPKDAVQLFDLDCGHSAIGSLP